MQLNNLQQLLRSGLCVMSSVTLDLADSVFAIHALAQ